MDEAVVYIRVQKQQPLPDHVSTLTATPSMLEKSKAGTVDVTLTATFEKGWCLDHFTVGSDGIEGNSFCFKESVLVGVVAKRSSVPVTSVAVSPKTASVYTGDTVSLAAEVKPEDATTKGVTWSSSDAGVATVDASGSVKGVAAGTATITARATDGSGKSDSATVTVKSEFEEAKSQIDDLIRDYEKKASGELEEYKKNVSKDVRDEIAEYGRISPNDMRNVQSLLKLSGAVLSSSSSVVNLSASSISIQLKAADVLAAGFAFSGCVKLNQAAGALPSCGGFVEDLFLLMKILWNVHVLAFVTYSKVAGISGACAAIKSIHNEVRVD